MIKVTHFERLHRMVKDKRIKVADEFKRAAVSTIGSASFEQLYETYYPRVSDSLVQNIISTYGKNLRPLNRLLDCGSGIGYYSLKLHEWYGSEVIALDISKEACNCIRNWNDTAHYPINVVCGDMQQLPLENNAVDWSFCMGGSLCILPEPHLAIQEMVRVTRSNGGLLFSIVNPDHFLIRKVVKGWGTFHKIVPEDIAKWAANTCNMVLIQPRYYLSFEYLYLYTIPSLCHRLLRRIKLNPLILRFLRHNGPRLYPWVKGSTPDYFFILLMKKS